MSGHAYGEPAHVEPSPYCGHPTEADYVDIGVGMIQCGPFHCAACKASQIGPCDNPRELTEREKETGWYEPGAEPGSSANVINGEIVSANAAKYVYRKEFINNPLHAVPGYVDTWRENLRKKS